MQPLKRFTQCGSLTMLFCIFIILFGVSSTALTTFGKSNPTSTPKPVAKGRECNTHEDCGAINRTSCVKDPKDLKLRCLCGNDKPPVNGYCDNFLRGLRHRCNANSDCEDGLVCQLENSSTIGVAKFMSTKGKLCLCDNESGYFEDVVRDICSGAANIVISLLTSLLPFVVYSNFKDFF